jgi:hypothetical protein
MWNIHCEVWGGVTGHRMSLLKDSEGNVAVFDTKESAEDKARELNEYANGPHKTCNFSYTVIKRRN